MKISSNKRHRSGKVIMPAVGANLSLSNDILEEIIDYYKSIKKSVESLCELTDNHPTTSYIEALLKHTITF